MTIENGRSCFYQWDLDQRVIVDGYPAGTEVHFAIKSRSAFDVQANRRTTALVVVSYTDGGAVYADVPNLLLQSAGDLYAYIFADNKYTATHFVFTVIPRKQPDDYVYTETDVNRWTTLATELQDVRIGADGATYPTAGDAVRGQMNAKFDKTSIVQVTGDAEDKVMSQKAVTDIVKLPIGDIIADEFVNYSNGEFTPISGHYVRTNYLPCWGTRYLEITSAQIADLSGLAFYDENYLFISGLQINVSETHSSATNSKTVVTVPNNAHYFAFSSLTDPYSREGIAVTIPNRGISECLSETKFALALIQDVNLTTKYQDLDIVKNEGAFVNFNGSLLDIATYFYSDLVEVHEGEIISVTSTDPSGTNVARVSIWANEEATRALEILDYGTTTESTFTYIPTETVLLRFSGYTANSMIVSLGTIEAPTITENYIKKLAREIIAEEQYSSTDFWKYALSNIICIGDSLTSGATFAEEWGEDADLGSSIQQNIPYYLGRMLNCETTNAGKSGWSANDWWRDYINTPAYDFSKYDSAVIWLGTNYGCSTMPTDEEIEAFVPDSTVTASEANQALYLIEIIKAIQTAKDDCYIILCNCFASKSNVATNNEVVAQIADKYGCHLLDMSDLTVAKHPELHANVNNPHFGKAGNLFIANRIATAVSERIENNPLLAEFGYTPRTN